MSDRDEMVTARYSHNPEFIWAGWSLYARGLSLANIAKMLKPEWPDVSVRTLQRVAKDQGWAEARTVHIALWTKAMNSVDGVLPETILNLQRMIAQLESKPALTASEMFAYRGLVEDLLMYTGKHPKLKDDAPIAVSDDREIAALLEVIQSDEVLGAAWRKRRRHVEKAYREKLEQGEKKMRNAETRRGKGAKG